MGENYALDNPKQLAIYEKYLKPFLLYEFSANQIISNEKQGRSDLQRQLDQQFGLDLMIIKDQNYCTAAIRIQEDEKKLWDTFTIRYSRASGTTTEWSKLNDHIDNDQPYPEYWVQAYLMPTEQGKYIIQVAIIPTIQLVKYLQANPKIRVNKKDGNEFIWCKWQDMREAGIKVQSWHWEE